MKKKSIKFKYLKIKTLHPLLLVKIIYILHWLSKNDSLMNILAFLLGQLTISQQKPNHNEIIVCLEPAPEKLNFAGGKKETDISLYF